MDDNKDRVLLKFQYVMSSAGAYYLGKALERAINSKTFYVDVRPYNLRDTWEVIVNRYDNKKPSNTSRIKKVCKYVIIGFSKGEVRFQ